MVHSLRDLATLDTVKQRDANEDMEGDCDIVIHRRNDTVFESKVQGKFELVNYTEMVFFDCGYRELLGRQR